MRAVLLSLFLVGCSNPTNLVEAQKPGTVSGAGATMLGPANSAAPSTLKATRVTQYAPKVVVPSPVIPVIDVKAPEPRAVPQAAPEVQSAPISVYEQVETTLGQHQDAVGLVKAASEMSKWPAHRWLGLIGVLLGVGGVLWSYKNEESGYPLVYIKVIVASAVVMMVSSPWWLLLGLIPLGLYVVQKLNLLRIP